METFDDFLLLFVIHHVYELQNKDMGFNKDSALVEHMLNNTSKLMHLLSTHLFPLTSFYAPRLSDVLRGHRKKPVA